MTTASDVLRTLRVASLRKVSVAGLDLYVRGLTGAERVLMVQRAKDGSPFTAHELAALALCDEHGAPLFTSEQAAELGAVDGLAVDAIATEILRASKLLPDEVESSAKN